MNEKKLTPQEKSKFISLSLDLGRRLRDVAQPDDLRLLRTLLSRDTSEDVERDAFGLSMALRTVDTALIVCDNLGPDRNMIISLLLYRLCINGYLTEEEVAKLWGEDIDKLTRGLVKVTRLYDRGTVPSTENFRKLLMTFADDIRVIIMMIINRLSLMRMINHHPDEKRVKEVASEARYLYSQLAHRLGLYRIKSELEDMSLKYIERQTYTSIANQLNATKVVRDAYIADFIKPVKERLERAGLKFEIKGRTKSIFSIWNKMKKQKVDLEHIYDLFAIRIILDSPLKDEKNDCWKAYAQVTDMYQPNPIRMKDWLSVPKSNGYESLHITVRGPESKWVEVQIRSHRMDVIAERGLAAHWKYKGVKSENDLDAWMNNVRDILEAAEAGPTELMRNMKMDIYDKEVFVFTPKGDLYTLPLGASLLDFAFHVHSRLGCTCIGGRVNGRQQKITYKLRSGDSVEILTASNQTPKADWLNYVVTSKARSKIRQTIKEQSGRAAELGKELLMRRVKNRKIELDEAKLMRLIKKLGYKTVTDFYLALSKEQIDVNDIIESYENFEQKTQETPVQSAEEFVVQPDEDSDTAHNSDVLVIGQGNIKGLNYKLAKCCSPIYGDDVFGFVSSTGVIKVHRHDCPNSANIREKYPDRLIPVKWSGKLGDQFGATLRVVGKDDIGIVTNITSLINKEKNVSLRSISIDSHDGLFQGFLIVGVSDTGALKNLIKKIKTVKGVKDVERSM